MTVTTKCSMGTRIDKLTNWHIGMQRRINSYYDYLICDKGDIAISLGEKNIF